jgi:DNA (cytosine-5)-methyltransferase 1
MLRAIREIAPRYVVGENVRGLTNWNGGMVFNEVCSDLEALGYSVAPFIIPASAVNAPHQRERVWFVAHNFTRRIEKMCQWSGNKNKPVNATNANGNGLNERDCEHEKHPSETGFDAFDDINQDDERGNPSDTNGTNSETWTQREILGQSNRKEARRFGNVECEKQWQNFPTQSPVCGGDDGLPTELDGITFPKWRNESIKGYGNAIVPQVVYQIFKAIEAYEA